MSSSPIRIDDKLMSKSQRLLIINLACSVASLLFHRDLLATELEASTKVAASEDRDIQSYESLQKSAIIIAAKPFEASPALPEAWASLSYDEYRKVVFDPNKAIWRPEGAPFFLEAFHRGFVHRDRVALHEIDVGNVQKIPFRSSMFDYRGELDGTSLVPDFGFAGFRVVGKFPEQNDWQEMLTFLGASYFRARTATGVYGASARGLAINVGLNKPEEFPVFRSFWVEKPLEGATTVRILALLDSPSAVGAYQFRFEPGVERTILDVDATLIVRNAIERVGIAPLTSMWMWGNGLDRPGEDSRPEVHDSDALVFCGRSEDQQERWTCRSLMRQNYPSIVQFPQTSLIGFGLAQRDVQPDHYNDNEAKYHLRPSIWVEPTTDWGPGTIQLLELPAEHEGIDNVAVWWSPSTSIEPMTPLPLSYRITFASGDPTKHSLLKVVAHRIKRPVESQKSFEIGLTFASTSLTREIVEPSTVEVVSSGVRCEMNPPKATQNKDGSWSIALTARPTTDTEPFELKIQLVQGGRPLSETWSYLCPIQPPPVALPPWRQKP